LLEVPGIIFKFWFKLITQTREVKGRKVWRKLELNAQLVSSGVQLKSETPKTVEPDRLESIQQLRDYVFGRHSEMLQQYLSIQFVVFVV
jgi:hypothetical protein